jgi:hypothetical protein
MNTLSVIRRWLLAVLALGLLGSGAELLLLEHYETAAQWVPLMAIALALAVLIWHSVKGDALSIRALQATMVLFVAAGIAGAGLHFLGAAEFQLEIDPSQSRWQIAKKAMRAKAPPVLAPGLMLQLGLVGLAYAYRHPALDAPGLRSSSQSDGVMK